MAAGSPNPGKVLDHTSHSSLTDPPVRPTETIVMFYSHEILTQRKYGVATIWFAHFQLFLFCSLLLTS